MMYGCRREEKVVTWLASSFLLSWLELHHPFMITVERLGLVDLFVCFVSLSGSLLLKEECLFTALQNCCSTVCSSCDVQEFTRPGRVVALGSALLLPDPCEQQDGCVASGFGPASFSASAHVGQTVNPPQFFS